MAEEHWDIASTGASPPPDSAAWRLLSGAQGDMLA